MAETAFSDNSSQSRFELVESGLTAFATYRGGKDALTILHVEAPPALRGHGTAGRLMQAIIAHARAEGIKLVPRCAYAVAWFARHTEDADVLAVAP